MYVCETVLMSGHNVCLNGKIRKIIPKIILVAPSYLEHWLLNLLVQLQFINHA